MASFGDFVFGTTEHALAGTYSDWQRTPAYDEVQPLGSARSDISLLSIGSARLLFENRLSRARYQEAEALVGTVALLQDFEGGSRTALLYRLEVAGFFYGPTRDLRVRWEFVEQ
jgi:hypothetical protein